MRVSRLLAFIIGSAILLVLYRLIFRSSSPLGVVRYKVGEEEETGYLSDEEIHAYVDALQDTRPVRCRDQAYEFTRLDVSETISIVMDFNGKQFYGLQLTLASVVEHTPFDLYQEIVVIDDGTSDMVIRKQVAEFLKNPRYSKVKLYRAETFDGQSTTRFKASQLAKGSILIYVSSTTVVNHGWIQPLISHVSQDDQLIAVPHSDNLLTGHRFYRTDDMLVPTFTWSLYTVYLESEEKGSDELLTSPVMRGDAFAVKKSFLQSIGNFDEHFRGGESSAGHHLELSLRAWMCGGSVKVATCSRVATHSALRPHHVSDQANYRRIAELWFGKYRSFSYSQGEVSSTVPEAENKGLTIRRGHLKQVAADGGAICNNFDWYLKHVAKDVALPSSRVVLYGKVKVKTNYCLRMTGSGEGFLRELDMGLCRQHIYDKSMMFEMNKVGWIFSGEHCLEPDDSGAATLKYCVEGEKKQVWKLSDHKLRHVESPGKCLTQVTERDDASLELVHNAKLMDCVNAPGTETARLQTWEFIRY